MKILFAQWRKDRVVSDHEFDCFTRYAKWDPASVQRFDACEITPSIEILNDVDALVIGGSGDYLVSQGDIPERINGMERVLHEARHRALPTIGICFGSQIMTKAFGGIVVKDESREEAGTYHVQKEVLAQHCPILKDLPKRFASQLGHKDHLEYLPDEAVNLATSERSTNQYWTFSGEPFYAVLWHPELDEPDMQFRVRFYAKVYGWDEERVQEIFNTLSPSPHASNVLPNFFEEVVKKGRVFDA